MKCNIERNRLVRAAKDMNDVLGLKPKIATKDKSEDEIAAEIAKNAKGYNEETKKYDADNAVTREDELQADTFSVLEELGALTPAKKAAKAEKPVTKKLGEQKAAVKSASTRGGGIRTKDFKTLKNVLTTGNVTSIASQLDKMTLEPHSVAELQAAMDKVGKINVVGHIKYRYENCGFDYKDKRKTARDLEGIVQLVGISEGVSASNKREFPLAAGTAEKPAKKAEPKAEKKAKDAPKGEKPSKKAKKEEEPKAEKKAKKSKE